MSQVGANWNRLVAELNGWHTFGRELERVFTPLEAESPAACRGDEWEIDCANAGFNAPRELLRGLQHGEYHE